MFLKNVLEAATSFVATNLDDIMILTIFYSQVSPTFRTKHIILGQYLGFSVLILLSLPGFFGSFVIPRTWIGLIGLLPIAIALQMLIRHQNNEVWTNSLQIQNNSTLAWVLSPQIYHVAAVTFANGGDNIGVYIPLFASTTLYGLGTILSTFYLLVAVWCYVAYQLTRYAPLANILHRYGKIAVPYILISLGLYILIENGTYKLLPLSS
jgi:cadmium resistance transport/sequestration family protein